MSRVIVDALATADEAADDRPPCPCCNGRTCDCSIDASTDACYGEPVPMLPSEPTHWQCLTHGTAA